MRADYQSLSESEQIESEFCFFPTVFIDFDTRTFYCSHPESHYLGFSNYLPERWQYKEVQNAIAFIPLNQRYSLINYRSKIE
ncbi:hypothetical protein [Roseofilum casamattae]|uniref:Uncharacterized protein n=1 Tax=Roseofilum casamattae BLCC-M143 TaxID=3022442 RepID=A0ABT7BZ96_9CYAN|nr:hypothetical protein [Roseofilum casamattae]MDJ1184486.1 hypothetical protein [Roseofilum casamattae BLCC-M143]